MLLHSVFLMLFLCCGCFSSDQFLVSNQIENIHQSTPLNITKLQMMDSYSGVKTFTLLNSKLEPREMSKLSALHSVIWINLSYNNMCCDFDFHWLIGCQNLQYLHLDHNKFRYIKSTLINEDEFPNLIIVDLSYNNMYYISMSTFRRMPRLRNVNLSHNKLARIDGFSNAEHFIPFVNLIDIGGNFFTCDTLLTMLQLDQKSLSINNMLKFRWYSDDIFVESCSNKSLTAITKDDIICCRHPESVNSSFLQLKVTKIVDEELPELIDFVSTTKNYSMESSIQINTQIPEQTSIKSKSTIQSPKESINIDTGVPEFEWKTLIFIIFIILLFIVIILYLTAPLLCKPYDRLYNRRNSTSSNNTEILYM